MCNICKTQMVLPYVLALIGIAVIAQHVNACVYNDTSCTCAPKSGETTCLRPLENNSSLCEAYACSSGFTCDCSGSNLCAIAECSATQRSYLPTTILSSSNITSCVVSEVSICTTVVEEVDDSSEDSEISYNYTIVASGDFTVYSGGESLYSAAVRAPRRGGDQERTGCDALIIELMYSYDPEIEQGLSFAIQETDSDAVYVSGNPNLTVRIAFNPSGDYRATESFDFSSWISPATRANLRGVGSFGEASDEFGAQPLGFDSTNDTSANSESGTYVYYIELPFCENSRSIASQLGKQDKQKPSMEEDEKHTMSPSQEYGNDNHFMTNESGSKTPGIPPGFEDVSVIVDDGDFLSNEQLAELDIDLEGLPMKKMNYYIVGSGNIGVYVLGKQARKASMMAVIQGDADIPCVPILVEMDFESGSSNSIPSISVILEMEKENGTKTYVSGSSLKVAVSNEPLDAYLDPKAHLNFSIFALAVSLPTLRNKVGFSLLYELNGAMPVGYNHTSMSDASYITSSGHTASATMKSEEGSGGETGISDVSVMQTRNKAMLSKQETSQVPARATSVGNMTIASNYTYLFVIYPPCANLFAFDDNGHAHEISTGELESFHYGMDLNSTYGEHGKPMDDDSNMTVTTTEPNSDIVGNIDFVYSEGEIDTAKLISDGYLLEEIPTTEITFLMTASDSYNVTVLGQQVENGSIQNILFGTAEVPCTPMVIETLFVSNQSQAGLPGLSLAIAGESPGSVVNVTTASTSLPILVAVNPRPGYDKIVGDYNFSDFERAVPAPSISNTSGFGLMKKLVGAIPVGPMRNNSQSMSPNFSPYPYNATEMNTTPNFVKVVYIVRLPTCAKLYKFGSDRAPTVDEVLTEKFQETGHMPSEAKTPEHSYESHSSSGEGSEIGDDLGGHLEAIFENLTKYKGLITENWDVLKEGLHSALGEQLVEIPSREVQIALLASNNFKVFVLGKQVVEVPKNTILPGSVHLPCTPLIVEMEFQNDSDIKGPFISVVLRTLDDVELYVSGKDLHIAVAFRPPQGYTEPKTGFLFSDLVPAAPFQNITGTDAFDLLHNLFDSAAVGFAKNMSDGKGALSNLTSMVSLSDKQFDTDTAEEDGMMGSEGALAAPMSSFNESNVGNRDGSTTSSNGTMRVPPNGTYAFIIYPPCSSLYSLDKDGKPIKEEVSSNISDAELDSGPDDEEQTEEFFHITVGNSTETVPFADSAFDVDKIVEDLSLLGFNIDELPISQFMLEISSTENFEVFAVGHSIENGYKGQVLRGEAFLPCTPILVVSKYMANESIIMPAISVAITHEMPDSEVTFVSGNSISNKSIDIWVDFSVDLELDGSHSGYNFSSLEHAIETPSLRNFSSFSYLEDKYGAVPVGPRLTVDFGKTNSEPGGLNDSTAVENPDSSSSSEEWVVYIVFAIQPPMCDALFRIDEHGMFVADDLFQNDEEDLSQEMPNSRKENNGTSEEPGSLSGMDTDLDIGRENVASGSDGAGSSNATSLTEDEDNGGVKNTIESGLEGTTSELEKVSDYESTRVIQEGGADEAKASGFFERVALK